MDDTESDTVNDTGNDEPTWGSQARSAIGIVCAIGVAIGLFLVVTDLMNDSDAEAHGLQAVLGIVIMVPCLIIGLLTGIAEWLVSLGRPRNQDSDKTDTDGSPTP